MRIQRNLLKNIQLALLTISTSFTLTPSPLANSNKELTGEFFVENIEIVNNQKTQITPKEKDRLREIASLPEQTNVRLPNQKLLQSATNRLFLQGYIVTIHPITLKNIKCIKWQIRILQKLKKIQSITWKGANKVEIKELLAKIPFQKEKILIPYQKEKAIAVVETYFKQKGYAKVNVQLVEEKTEKDFTNLHFTIEKNKKIYIRDVVYKGNSYLTTHELIKRVYYTKEKIKNRKTLVKKLLSWDIATKGLGHIIHFFSGTPYIQELVQQDMEHLKRYYQSKGFIDVAISYQVTYRKKNHVDVLFDIVEGKQYKIGRVIWYGNQVCTDDELNAFCELKPGKVFDLVSLQKKIQGFKESKNIKDLYEQKGYSLASFDINVQKSGYNKVNIAIKIQEKPQSILNKIIIEKSQPISFDVRKILKQSGLHEGKVITREKVKNARNMLMCTNLFDAENISFSVSPEGDKETLTCYLPVKKSHIYFKGGLAGWDGFINVNLANINIKKFLKGKRNYIGTQKLIVQFNQNIPRILTKFFQEPKNQVTFRYADIIHTLYAPITTNLDFFIAPSVKGDQKELTRGVVLNMMSKRGGDIAGSLGSVDIGFHSVGVENLQLNATESLSSANINNLFLQLYYKKHNVDNVFYPSVGSSWSVDVKKSFGMPSAQDIDTGYWRMGGTYSLYTKTGYISSLGRSLGIKLKSSIGCSSFDGNSPVGGIFLGSPDGRYLSSSLGGYYVGLRGYESKNMPIASPGSRYTGGAYYFMQNVEFRYMLAKSTSYGLMFIDFASASYSIRNPFCTYGLSTGIGFRTKTFLGMDVGFDVGWALIGKRSLKPTFYFRFGRQL